MRNLYMCSLEVTHVLVCRLDRSRHMPIHMTEQLTMHRSMHKLLHIYEFVFSNVY